MFKTLIATFSTSILLAACGGGGGGGDAAERGPTAEGVYGGTQTGSPSTAFQALVLENDEFWFMYGTQTSSLFLINGFIQGAGASNNGVFSASTIRDFGVLPPQAGTANATYSAAAKTISGSATFGTRTVSFSGGPIAGSLYTYNTPAVLTSISGNWTVSASTSETITISVTSTGTLTLASSAGCTGTGTATPRPSGKNVFNVSISFGASRCRLPNATLTGIAIVYPLSNGRSQLLGGARTSDQLAAFFVAGTR